MARIRNAFRRQDSSMGTTAHVAPTPDSITLDHKDNEEHELSGLGDDKDGSLGQSDPYEHEHDEHRPVDPSAQGLQDLDPDNLLSDGKERPIETDEDFATRLVATFDDVDQPINTLRMYIIGLGLTAFAAVLSSIFFFRPSSLTVSGLFILIIAYGLGNAWFYAFKGLERMVSGLSPSGERSRFWNFINPDTPLSLKEHVAILIMCTTAFSSAMAINVIAADSLYYSLDVNYGQAIFELIGSQLFGYGLAGLARSIVVFPTYAQWPNVLPTVQLFQLLHSDTSAAQQRKRMTFFATVAALIFVWEWFPEFIAPMLTGISIFCLAHQSGTGWYSRIFAGAGPNTGMGVGSICLDWTYLSGWGAFYTPLTTMINVLAGLYLSIIVACTVYAGNVWQAKNFPFLAQDLFYENGSTYDQMSILDENYNLNRTALEEQGLPWQATTMVIYYLGINLALGATITHCLLWYREPCIKAFREFRSRSVDDKHFAEMLKYKEVPMFVYGGIVLASFAMAMATCYTGDSHLPWYGVVAAFAIAAVLFPFLSVFPSITGWQISAANLIQILGSAIVPGNPQANMYFSLYGSNAATQGINFASDLKLAQYTKVPPRTTLWVQSLGTVVGGILQIVMTKQIIKTHREILLDPEGTTIWSGMNVQSFNSQSVTWGALAKDLYGTHSTYQILPLGIVIGLGVPVLPWVVHRYYPHLRLNLLITPLFCYTLGYLAAGINSTHFMALIIALTSQLYWRKRHPTSFRKYNYLLSAALDCGSQFFTFIFTLAIQGAGNGVTQTMPIWALNPDQTLHNVDYCAINA